MFVNEPFESVPDAAREEIITETVYRLEPHLFKNGVWHADYVRLRMKVEKHIENGGCHGYKTDRIHGFQYDV